MFDWFKKKSSGAAVEALSSDCSRDNSADSPEISDDVSPDTIVDERAQDPVKQPVLHTFAPTAPQETEPGAERSGGILRRLKQGLARTRQVLNTNVEDLFKGRSALDDDLLEQLEELLITADIGVAPTLALMTRIKKRAREIHRAADLLKVLKEELVVLLQPCEPTPDPLAHAVAPRVIMVVGVNGVGKTTTIGKLAARYRRQNRKVLIAAADTFRAAAVEQLTTWAERAGAELVRHRPDSDPAAVAFDGVAAALARGMDVAIIDTAGRLHTKVNLMEELKKIQRAITKKMPEAPHEVLLVLDATTGQNAVSQARLFHEALGVTGLVLTKLDGTAKGGIVISICRALQVPLQYIGVGEQIDDLQDFKSADFVEAMF